MFSVTRKSYLTNYYFTYRIVIQCVKGRKINYCACMIRAELCIVFYISSIFLNNFGCR